MSRHEDMVGGMPPLNGMPQAAPQTLDLGNGVVVSIAESTRKSGLNDGDVEKLVKLLQAGHSWQAACKAVTSVCSISGYALAAWRGEIERRAAVNPNAPRSLKTQSVITGDLVLPSARNEREQCPFRFGDLPSAQARCILRKHLHGGHVPGTPKFEGSGGLVLTADTEPEEQLVETAPGALAILPGSEIAQSARVQCRHVDDDGERCVLAIHDVEQRHLSAEQFDLVAAQAARPRPPVALAVSPKEQCRHVGDEGERCLLVVHEDLDAHVFTRPAEEELEAEAPAPERKPAAKRKPAKRGARKLPKADPDPAAG